MGEGIQVQGLCRFSYPCTGGFKKYHGSLEERRAALYAPNRLDSRCLWFEHVFVPGIEAQTDKDFTLHILLGEDLPRPWRDRVETVLGLIPQLAAHWRGPDDHRKVCREVLWGGRDHGRAIVAEFRLDDDDAVAVDYVAQLRRNWPRVSRLAGPNGRVALDHGKGMVLEGHDDGRVEVHTLLTHCWSAGLAAFLRPEDTATIMDFPHHRIWQRLPYVNLTEHLMFVRGDHGSNDAQTPFAGAKTFDLPEVEVREALLRRFRIDLDGFRSEYGQSRGR